MTETPSTPAEPGEPVPSDHPAENATPPTDTPAGAPLVGESGTITDDGGRVETGTAEEPPEQAPNTVPVGQVTVEDVLEQEQAEAEQAAAPAEGESTPGT